jgi:hypothetical protein
MFDMLFSGIEIAAGLALDCAEVKQRKKDLVALEKKNTLKIKYQVKSGLAYAKEKGAVLIKDSGKVKFLPLSHLRKFYQAVTNEVNKSEIYPSCPTYLEDKQHTVSIIEIVERLPEKQFVVFKEYYYPIFPFRKKIAVVISELDF